MGDENANRGAGGDARGVGAALATAAGATAGAAVVVYVAGAALLRVRYGQALLTEDPLISSLPREYLAAIGVRSIVLPALIVAAIAVLVVYSAPRRTPPRVLASAGCLAGMLVTVGFAVQDGVSQPSEWRYATQYELVIAGLLASCLPAFIALRNRDRARPWCGSSAPAPPSRRSAIASPASGATRCRCRRRGWSTSETTRRTRTSSRRTRNRSS